MIPLKLQIKNFLSYGPELQTIDFTKHRLICLSGKNGHGKSALLDAITWALWGQARKISGVPKSDGSLLRLGQTQMMVLLDFSCNNQTYRIKREYYKTYGKPIVKLDFGILSLNNESFSSLTDKTVRLTQKKVEKTIRLTFETFTNSAFLRQGQANEFSKKSPKERKEIFAHILGLQQYESVKKLASEKVKSTQIKEQCILSLQEKLVAELETETNLLENLKTVSIELKNVTQQEQKIEQEIKTIQKAKETLSEQEKKSALVQFKYQECLKQKREHKQKQSVLQEEWEQIEKQKTDIADLSLIEKQKKQLSEDITTLQKTFQTILELKTKRLKQHKLLQDLEKLLYEKEISEEENKKTELNYLTITQQNKLKNYNELNDQYSLKQKNQKKNEKQKDNLQKQYSAYTINEKICIETEKKLFKNKEKYQKLILQGNLLKQEIEKIVQKEQLYDHDEMPSCPLCEQDLSASKKQFLKIRFVKQRKQIKKNIEIIALELQQKKPALLEQHKNLIEQKSTLEKKKVLALQLSELEKKNKVEATELETVEKKLATLKTDMEIIEKKQIVAKKDLENQIAQKTKNKEQHPEYKQYCATLAMLDKKLKLQSYDEKQHQKKQQEFVELEKQLISYSELYKQRALQPTRKKHIEELATRLQTLQKEEKIYTTEVTQYKNINKQKKTLIDQEKTTRQAVAKLKNKKEELFQKKGSFENQKQTLQTVKKDLQKHTKKLQELRHYKDDYAEIAYATSKNGIQALLIENAIPEVEHEANRILANLTNNQAQIFIESLRDLQKGGTKETLDIKISDTVGIRPYELFSGGEAFRIDFALRIAISKLLARRSGASLQTLIIDEGFGSQDEEGLTNIMEALYKIQNDFSKIIIVSHLNSMKDQFPVHFLVKKGAQGSHITVHQFG